MPELTLSDGLALHYEEWGDASAPAVLLLHGFTSSLRMWSQQVEPLSRDYRVIAPDLRGHGLSGSPEDLDAYGIARYADDIRELLDALGLTACAVVGCSFGGMIALQLATTWPERVAALVVSDSSPAHERPEYADGFRERERLMAENEEFVRRRGTAGLGKHFAASVSDPFVANGLRERYSRLDTNGFLGAARTRRERPDLVPLLREKLSMPVLLCWGEDDPVATALDVMLHELPGARVATFKGAGHGLPTARPGPFTDLLLQFLADVEDGATVGGRKRL